MTGLDVWLLAFGLSMDCLAVAIASGIVLRRIRWKPILSMAVVFAFFQGGMPLLGWMGGRLFSHLIESVDHWIAFFILTYLGVRMIRQSFAEKGSRLPVDPMIPGVVALLAMATSIDALVIGVSFACLGVRECTQILPAVAIIALVTFVMTLSGLLFSIKYGNTYARRLRAECWGGAILVLIGLKILIEHLFFP